MIHELNQIIEAFTSSHFQVQGVYRYKIPANSSGTQKSAPFPGFVFTLGGQVQLDFNGTPYVADTQTVIHGGADMTLGKRVLGDGALEYICVLYDAERRSKSGLYLPDIHFKLEIGQNHRLKGLLHRLWKVSHVPGAMSSFQKETLFHCILEELFVCANNRPVSSDKVNFIKISSYIQENYAEEISIGVLAEIFGMTTNQLYYIFAKHTDMGPGDYLIAYRLNRAKELLLTTDLFVHEIAYAVGYEDPLYFSRIFKQRFANSPQQLRKAFRNNP